MKWDGDRNVLSFLAASGKKAEYLKHCTGQIPAGEAAAIDRKQTLLYYTDSSDGGSRRTPRGNPYYLALNVALAADATKLSEYGPLIRQLKYCCGKWGGYHGTTLRFMDLEADEVESMQQVAAANRGRFFMPGFFSTSKKAEGAADFSDKNTKIYVEIPYPLRTQTRQLSVLSHSSSCRSRHLSSWAFSPFPCRLSSVFFQLLRSHPCGDRPAYTWALEVDASETNFPQEEEVLLTCWTEFELVSVTPGSPGTKRVIRLRAVGVDGGVGRGVQTGVKTLGANAPRVEVATELSARDEELVQQLRGLGFDQDTTVRAYIDSGKDFMLAQNYLADKLCGQ